MALWDLWLLTQCCPVKALSGGNRRRVRVNPATRCQNVCRKRKPASQIGGSLNHNSLSGNAIDADAKLRAVQFYYVQNRWLLVGNNLDNLRRVKITGMDAICDFSVDGVIARRNVGGG